MKPPPGTEPATVFLPGWGFDGRILRLLTPAPPWIYPETMLDPGTIEQDLLSMLAAENIGRVRLVGWSMGAMLGLEFAADHHDLVDSLVLAALRAHWQAAEIAAIRAEFCRSPVEFLQDFYRKCFLGDKQMYSNFRAILEPLYLAAAQADSDRLQHGLDYLAAFRSPGPPPGIPTRLVHGRQDIIAPVDEMARLPGAEVEIIDNGGHAVFLHEKSSLRQDLKKQAIRDKFSRAADSYDNYAEVQAVVAARLAAKLPRPQNGAAIGNILEIGCGTGNFTALLRARFPKAKIVALDFSPAMIAQARRKPENNTVAFICADGERYLAAAADRSFDLVASNGSLQWFADIDPVLHHIRRILTAGGVMAGSIFGPESLHELGEGLRSLEPGGDSLAARTFPTRQRLQQALHENFPTSTVDEEDIIKEYPSAYDLLLHIKKTGTSGWPRQLQPPLTPSRIRQLDAWFRKTHGACRVTYQVFFLHGRNEENSPRVRSANRKPGGCFPAPIY